MSARWHDLQDRVADLNQMYRDDNLSLFEIHRHYMRWYCARLFKGE